MRALLLLAGLLLPLGLGAGGPGGEEVRVLMPKDRLVADTRAQFWAPVQAVPGLPPGHLLCASFPAAGFSGCQADSGFHMHIQLTDLGLCGDVELLGEVRDPEGRVVAANRSTLHVAPGFFAPYPPTALFDDRVARLLGPGYGFYNHCYRPGQLERFTTMQRSLGRFVALAAPGRASDLALETGVFDRVYEYGDIRGDLDAVAAAVMERVAGDTLVWVGDAGAERLVELVHRLARNPHLDSYAAPPGGDGLRAWRFDTHLAASPLPPPSQARVVFVLSTFATVPHAHVVANVRNLLRHHPRAEVFVVDNASPDRSHVAELQAMAGVTVELRGEHEAGFELGACAHVYKTRFAGREGDVAAFVCTQDMVRLRRPLPMGLLQAQDLTALYFYFGGYGAGMNVARAEGMLEWHQQQLDAMGLAHLDATGARSTVFSCSFAATPRGMRQLLAQGLFDVVVDAKWKSVVAERLLGQVFDHLGWPAHEFALEGHTRGTRLSLGGVVARPPELLANATAAPASARFLEKVVGRMYSSPPLSSEAPRWRVKLASWPEWR